MKKIAKVLLGMLVLSIGFSCSVGLTEEIGSSSSEISQDLNQRQVINDQTIRNSDGDEIILQGFYWESNKTKSWEGDTWYKHLQANLSTIQDAGITMLWSPPPWRDTGANAMGYLWHSFDLNSSHGTASDLQNMLDDYNDAGISVIIDIVANHSDSRHPDPQWPWESDAWTRNNPDDPGYLVYGEHDLNTSYVWEEIKNQMNTLREMGAVGWRYDMVHGFPAGRILGWNQSTNAEFSVGEYEWAMVWNRNGEDIWAEDWAADAQSTVFDFWTQGNLRSGNPSTYGGLATNERREARARAVTFIDNHDTMRHNIPGPDDDWGARSKAYAWILLTPGTPSVYWEDLMEGKMSYDYLKNLIWTRRNADIRADSGFLLDESNGNGRAVIIDGNNHDIALSLDWQDWKPDGQWTKITNVSGWDGRINVWKSGGNPPPPEDWYYSGNSNGWGATAMEDIGNGKFQIQLNLQQGDGFKIRDSATSWSGASFPDENWKIWQGDGFYTITFRESDGYIDVSKGGSEENWYFSSNINGWSTWEMVDIGNNTMELKHWFDQGDSFKIRNTSQDWSGEIYPPGDNWRIWQGDGRYRVQFNTQTKRIQVIKD